MYWIMKTTTEDVIMAMYNPPHPGAFIKDTYLEPFHLSVRYLAEALDVSPSTVARIVGEKGRVSVEMAYRLAEVLGCSPESWLNMQTSYDLWQSRKKPAGWKLKHIDFKFTPPDHYEVKEAEA